MVTALLGGCRRALAAMVMDIGSDLPGPSVEPQVQRVVPRTRYPYARILMMRDGPRD